jgi:hypothetical protein
VEIPNIRTTINKVNRDTGRIIFFINTVVEARLIPCIPPTTIRVNAAKGNAIANIFRIGDRDSFENTKTAICSEKKNSIDPKIKDVETVMENAEIRIPFLLSGEVNLGKYRASPWWRPSKTKVVEIERIIIPIDTTP